MMLLQLWKPVLASLVFVEISWTVAIDRDQQPRPEDVELAEGYLKRFYNLIPRSRQRLIRSTSTTEEKIRQMQSFFGLRETGHLDPHTLDVMRKPRCGVPDVENFTFYPEKPKWRNNTITYMIAKYTPDLRREEVEKSLCAALKMWSDAAAPLRFIRVHHGKSDIVFSFARRTHGDFFPFDGSGGVLAHAFQSGEGIGGDVHFDEDETWTTGRQGYSLFAVAAHELGHSLGLTHSMDPSAVMYPNYRYHSSTQYALSMDDVHAIQTLEYECCSYYYFSGKPTKDVKSQHIPTKCDPNFSFDAATMIGNDVVFFKDRYMWMRTTWTTYWNQLREGHSSTYLPSIGSHVDAAYDIPTKGVAYVFTGCNTTLCPSSPISQAAPTVAPTVSPEDEDVAQGYLSRFYGDIGTTNLTLRSLVNDTFIHDLETMQAFFGLEVTGVLNKETVEVMKAPRCGVSDISQYGHFHGKPRWQKRLITYRITTYTPDMAQSQVDATITKAFQLYSNVIPLDFKQIHSGIADIMILFKGGYHGDFYPFDGAGGVLAHANSPGQGQGGDTHFDDDENWSLNHRDVNLLLVAAHEFGHALGLDHSRDRRALMFPTYQYVNTDGYRLPDDDRRGVQALYGSRTSVPTGRPTPTRRPEPEPEPEEPIEIPDPLPDPRAEQCSRGLVFDAATSIRGELYFFKSGYLLRL
ncbi:matrix metalloproteinase-20-like [Solea senegalensis]|uniref:Matrix metalloproteinase-20-like n=1 Tax=Solea senegalensis TaxID=28829 RepID=A0AAV6PZJ5_SOLSE|nr:matrix metalloproteinase-20-like [Solea senegalensis]